MRIRCVWPQMTVACAILFAQVSVAEDSLPAVPEDKPAQSAIAPRTGGPDRQKMMEQMAQGGVRCGNGRVLVEWHVLADGTVDDVRIKTPGDDSCFNKLVLKNARKVIDARLKMIAGSINGTP